MWIIGEMKKNQADFYLILLKNKLP